MVAYAYDYIARHNPVGLFGMIFVLEFDKHSTRHPRLTRATKQLDITGDLFSLFSFAWPTGY